ncbi:hypothetical protein MLD38_002250 [Melastoma candidum]|uniref:Uncharacterized protein n=1 Tax=Melastoma candidum TaxID=119954 RepID=A0ACB9SFR0_9MYRT|nr:hypothetical protein MLD38_002250 [Melastoma candidum]
MAKSSLGMAVGVGLFCLALLARQSVAYVFTVGGGGSTGWSIPSDPNVNAFNRWAEQNRFQIGDSIVFDYAPGDDSVLYVNKHDYVSCRTESPIAKYVDGHTLFQFNHSGPFYFISGNKDNCLKNEKLIVIVLADRSKKSAAPSGSSSTSPPPSSPSTEQAPSPPTAGTIEIIPTPAPARTEEPSPPNNSRSLLVSLIGSVGALIASSLLLAP